MNIRSRLFGRLKLKQLHLIAELEDYPSLFHAAKSLAITQPAATRALKDIELDLGIELFDRTNRSVVPTDYGKLMIRHAKLVLAQLSHASQELEDLYEGTGGRITVGTTLTATTFLLPKAILRLRNRRPNVTVHIIEGTNDRLIPRLRSGDIDMVVDRLSEFRYREEVIQEPLYDIQSKVVVRIGHPQATERHVRIDTLSEWDWILPPPETTLRRQIDSAFHEAGKDAPRASVESTPSLTVRSLLLNSDMISILPYRAIADDIESGKLAILPVAIKMADRPVGITRRRSGSLSPAAMAFLDDLRTVGGGVDQE